MSSRPAQIKPPSPAEKTIKLKEHKIQIGFSNRSPEQTDSVKLGSAEQEVVRLDLMMSDDGNSSEDEEVVTMEVEPKDGNDQKMDGDYDEVAGSGGFVSLEVDGQNRSSGAVLENLQIAYAPQIVTSLGDESGSEETSLFCSQPKKVLYAPATLRSEVDLSESEEEAEMSLTRSPEVESDSAGGPSASAVSIPLQPPARSIFDLTDSEEDL